MGALSPLFLVAAVAVGVPLFLHLFQRQEARRLSFPALRYLERTEREHARSIRFRQLLLLLLRVAAILVVVGAGARLFLRGRGSAHPPTAVAIVLDNSMSSGLVVGEERVLDRLEAMAMRTLGSATDQDRIWVIRAGEPWVPAVASGAAAAREQVLATSPTAARGDLSAALARAADLVGTSGFDVGEIHLLSDLQATAFDADVVHAAGELPVLVWAPGQEDVDNRAISSVLVGGGLPPLEGQRTEITVRSADGEPGDTVPVPVRVVLDDRIRGAGSLPPGVALTLPLPPSPGGWIAGYAEADPDALRADDRRYFAFRARPAPRVSVLGDPGLFVEEAVSVLSAAGRLQRVGGGPAPVIIAGGGAGLEGSGAGSSILIVPPGDPTLLPALNRRLADAGVPFRVEADAARGEADLEGARLPEPLQDVRVMQRYRLISAGDPPAPPRTLAHIGGEAWAVEGADARGRRYLLLASALDAASSSLPVSPDMVRFVDWVTGRWAASGAGGEIRVAGHELPAPRGAARVRLPSGAELDVDGTRVVRPTREAGLYTFLAGDSVASVEAVNPPVAESDLRVLPDDELEIRVGPGLRAVARERSWDRAIFGARQGPEMWWPLLLGALALLRIEAATAAAGQGRTQGEGARGTA